MPLIVGSIGAPLVSCSNGHLPTSAADETGHHPGFIFSAVVGTTGCVFGYLLLEDVGQRCTVGGVDELDHFVHAPLKRVSVQDQLRVFLFHQLLLLLLLDEQYNTSTYIKLTKKAKQ